MTKHNAVNRNLACVLKNWNSYSECFQELVKSLLYCPIQFNGKIMNMMLPTKICFSFHTQIFKKTLVVYCLLLHNFISKSPWNLFCLDLKITISVFFTLHEILFPFNQLSRCFKSALTSLFSFLIELLRHNRLLSPAKWWTFAKLLN